LYLRDRKQQEVGENYAMRRFRTIIKSRGMNVVRNVAYMTDMINAQSIIVRKFERRRNNRRHR
jgi:hypothetical protein